jgi:hypothetical protein
MFRTDFKSLQNEYEEEEEEGDLIVHSQREMDIV